MTVAVRPSKLHRFIVFLVCAVKRRHIQRCMACTNYTGGGSEWRFILSSSELTCLCVLRAALRQAPLLPAFHPSHAFPHHFKAAHRNCMLYFYRLYRHSHCLLYIFMKRCVMHMNVMSLSCMYMFGNSGMLWLHV